MPHTRVSALRSIAALVVLAALAFAIQGCGSRSHELEPGSYRAVLESPGGELPFGLDVAREESGLVVYLVNGKERVRVPEVVVEAGKLTARMPGYENALTATISGDELEGEVTLVRAGGQKQSMPLTARRDQTWRFYEEPLTDNAEFAGRWSVTFTGDKGKTSPGVAEFEQLFGALTGTILTPIGRLSVPRRRCPRRRTAAVAIRRRTGPSLPRQAERARRARGPALVGQLRSRAFRGGHATPTRNST